MRQSSYATGSEHALLPRDSDIILHIKQKAKVSGPGHAYQAGRDQVVNESNVFNVYMGAQPLPDSAPVPVKPPLNLRPRRLHGRDAKFQKLGAGDLQPLLGDITVLHGMGGIGKTAMALAIAGAMRRNGVRVFWVQASQVDSLRAALRQIALQLSGGEAQAREVAAGTLNATDLAWEALHTSTNPWLLIFDSADNPTEIERELGPGWLEGSAAGAVLVTTRQGSADLWPAEAKLEKLDALDSAAGAEMLLDLAGKPEQHPSERDAARALSMRLGGIPLALRLAGLCVSQPLSPLRSFEAFGRALDRDFEGVVDRAVDASLRPRTDDDARNLVMQTWEVSLDALEQQDIPHVRSIMRVLSCWAASPVPVELLSPKVLLRTHGQDDGPWTGLAVERSLRALNAVGLIDAIDENPVARPVEDNAFYRWPSYVRTHRCIVVHPLVAEVNAAHLERSPDRARSWAAAARCVGALRGMWGTEVSAGYWQLAVPHVASMAARLPSAYGELFEVIGDTQMYLSTYLRLSGQYEAGYRSAMVLHERLDSFHLSEKIRFLVHFDYAEWAWHMSRLEEAAALVAEACRLADGSVGSESFLGLMARELAIAIHAERGFLESGEQMARELCKELESQPKFFELSMQAQHHLATILRESGRLDEAEGHSRRAVQLMDQMHIPPFTRAVVRHELGVILWHRGHLGQALQVLDEVLRLQKTTLPPWHPSTLVTRYDIASIHGIQGNRIRALIDFTDIHLIEQELLGKDHRNTLQTKHQIGQILVELKELDQAESALREVEEGYRNGGLQDRSADILSTEHEIVHIKAQRGRHAEAQREWRKILEKERQHLGAEHPSTLRTHYNWAICWATLGFPGVARTEMKKVLAARRRALGADHYETRQTVRMLADLTRLPPEGWRFGGYGRRNVPTNREERRSNGPTSNVSRD
ncbi:tetratricopeptide repeat protein [Streptomyces nojiriensis]|uniref:tetratricopeptide repeat protein n=1 Tax=Streptomyces nojiriensis TaxID=66374 RepID=UPI00369FE779